MMPDLHVEPIVGRERELEQLTSFALAATPTRRRSAPPGGRPGSASPSPSRLSATGNIVIISLLAVAAPLLVRSVWRAGVAVIVVELLPGLAKGPHGFGWVEVGEFLTPPA